MGNTDTHESPSRRRTVPGRIAPALLICAVGTLIYSNTFHASFHFDDINNIVENEAIRDIRNIGAVWNFLNRRFIGYLSFALNYRFHRLDVFGYHAVNLVIHLAASTTAWLLSLTLLSTPAMRKSGIARVRGPAALLCGLVFVSHPLQTQAVTYIVQRLTSLAAFFYLSALLLYTKARLSRNATFKTVFYAGSAAAALMGIFTKEIVYTLPFAVVMIEFFFFRTGKPGIGGILRRRAFWLTALPLLSFLFILPYLLSFNLKSVFGPVPSQRYPEPELTSLTYFLTQTRVMVRYLRLLFLPLGQNLDYDFPASRSFFEPPVLLSLGVLAAAASAAVVLFRKHRLVSFGTAWFFLTLSVESSFKPLQNVIFEHRLYLPMFGFSLVVAGLVHRFAGKKGLRPAAVVSAVLICAYSCLTYSRNETWKDDISLWSDTAAKSPRKARPHLYLGLAYHHAGMAEEAKREYRKALEIYPGYDKAYLNLGNVLYSEGRFEDAIARYGKAVALNPMNGIAYRNLGRALMKTGRYGEARERFLRSLEISPAHAETFNNIGLTYYREGDLDEAEKYFRKAADLDPDYHEPHINLGNVFAARGKFGEAEAEYRTALNIRKDDPAAHFNLGNVYYSTRDFEKAAACYEKALEYEPDNARFHKNLGLALSNLGKYEEALGHLERSLETEDDFAVRLLAGVILKGLGRYEESLRHLSRALRLKPDDPEARRHYEEAKEHLGKK